MKSLLAPAAAFLLGGLVFITTVWAADPPTEIVFPPDTPDPLASLKRVHPRLLATAEQWDAIAKATDDPLKVEVTKRIIAAAERIIALPPEQRITYKLTGQAALLEPARKAMGRIVFCSAAYRLTHDPRFAARAKDEMLNVAAFPDWSPGHFLDVGELAMATAIGYDWCFDALSPADKKTIKDALMQKALVFAPGCYGPHAHAAKELDGRFWWVVNPYNWNEVCNSGMLAAALAIADEEPDVARQVVQGVRAYLPLSLHNYAPDGAWPEGPGYWMYGTDYGVLALALLESALGTDYGLSTVEPSFATTGMFHLQMQSPDSMVYNYADVHANSKIEVSAAAAWLAKRFGPPVAVAQTRADLALHFTQTPQDKEWDRMFSLQALWLPPAPAGDAGAAALDAHFHGLADVAVFRSAWGDPDALYLGFKNGRNGVNHGHLDLGSFVLDADGVRWSAELGGDNYDLPKYFGELRSNYFRLNNYGHSTITPGHTLQALKGLAPIYQYNSTPDLASATADLTPAYPGVATQMLRGVFFQNGARVLVQDDIAGLSANTPLNWQMITAAQIALSADNRTATLTQKGKTLKAELLSPANATFSVALATPPTPAIPTTPAEDPNKGYSILLGTVPANAAVADVRLAVLLTPVGPKWPANLPAPTLAALPTPTANP